MGVKCSWLIDARSHQDPYDNRKVTIRLHFEEFATECSWDNLYVFDGDSVDEKLLGVFR